MDTPIDDRLLVNRWVDRWRAALAASQRHGQRDDTAWGAGRVDVGPPGTTDDVAAIEATSGVTMPSGLRRLYLATRSVEAVWHLADDVQPPEPFGDIFAGECLWSIDRVVESIVDYRGWVDEVFPNPADPYDVVWHAKYPWLHVPNGDIIAIDVDGRVIYLSHDDGEGHGYVLGRDVFAFLDAWTRLGCPGPEDWQWLPFVSDSGDGLDPDAQPGVAWRAWFGIP
jgi:hypothetical protein